jgi:hypothetical protein
MESPKSSVQGLSQVNDEASAGRRGGRTKEWECHVCTLLNGYKRKTCAACLSHRQDDVTMGSQSTQMSQVSTSTRGEKRQRQHMTIRSQVSSQVLSPLRKRHHSKLSVDSLDCPRSIEDAAKRSMAVSKERNEDHIVRKDQNCNLTRQYHGLKVKMNNSNALLSGKRIF